MGKAVTITKEELLALNKNYMPVDALENDEYGGRSF